MHPSEFLDQAEKALANNKRAGAVSLLIDAMREQQLMIDRVRGQVKYAIIAAEGSPSTPRQLEDVERLRPLGEAAVRVALADLPEMNRVFGGSD